MSDTISTNDKRRLILEEFKSSGANIESEYFIDLLDMLIEKIDTGMTAEVIGRKGTKNYKNYILKNGYHALHHILPKSIFKDYVRESWNLLYLTVDEHILIHRLLALVYPEGSLENSKMRSAYHLMIKSENRKLDIDINYPEAKKDLALEFYKTPRGIEYRKQLSEMSKEFNSIYWDSEDGIAQRNINSERMTGSGNPCYGKTGNLSVSNIFVFIPYTKDLSLIEYFFGQKDAEKGMLEKYGIKIDSTNIRSCTVANHLKQSGYNRNYCGKYLGRKIKWKKVEKEYFLNEPSYFLSEEFLIN